MLRHKIKKIQITFPERVGRALCRHRRRGLDEILDVGALPVPVVDHDDVRPILGRSIQVLVGDGAGQVVEAARDKEGRDQSWKPLTYFCFGEPIKVLDFDICLGF